MLKCVEIKKNTVEWNEEELIAMDWIGMEFHREAERLAIKWNAMEMSRVDRTY